MKEQIDLAGDVSIVTGGASGIGFGVAEELAREGSDVVIIDIDSEKGSVKSGELSREYGSRCLYIDADVSEFDECLAAVETVLDDLGKIDVLVNCAAATGLRDNRPFREETPEDWIPHLEVTFGGVLNFTRAVLPHMAERGEGAIVNISSSSYHGLRTNVPHIHVYASMKSAIVTFTKSLGREIAKDGIRMNAIAPSFTPKPDQEPVSNGDNMPIGRLGRPEDTAYMVIFLVSDAASWVVGETVNVNGGFI